MMRISGAKGGGGGGKGGGGGGSQQTPTEAANSLFSTSYAKLVDLISEGEIYGLKNGLKSIYVDNTPLQNADNSYNFQNVTVFTRTGTQSQSYIPGFDDVANEVAVGVTVQKATPVVRSITNTAVNAARITITVPQLQQIADNGDINGASVQLQIAMQYNGGGYTTVINDTISGRTSQQYQRQYLVNLSGAYPVDIKVTRVTADSSSAKLSNAFSWSSYTEVTYAKLAYPNSALVGVRIDAQQFSNIPERAYQIRGIKVKIPSNATVDNTTGRLIYSGVWDGTFGAAQWCSDPAWCLWDLLTSTRYGFGNHIDITQLDKWAFYSASQYSSTLVSDGFGGQEPRFSCNVNIQTEEDAYKLINDMCSVFRAMPYWSTGSLTVSQDKPSDPAYLFTYANVDESGFSYSGSSLKTRPNVAVVQYMDLSLRNTAYEVVENAASIAKYGVIKTQVTAFACTSRGQAHRVGSWLLYTANYEATETVTFTASIEAGVIVRPGQVIQISDPVRAGVRRGGRISAATTTTITVDNATGLTTTNSPTLSVILNDGTVQTRTVSSIAGNVITVGTAFSSAPNVNSVWIYETTDLKTTTWRVLGVQEQDQCKYAVTALAYNSSKYNYVENGFALQTNSVSYLNAIPSAPTNLVLTETLYLYQSQVRSKVIASWAPVTGVNQYIVKWRKDSGNWQENIAKSASYEILDITPGVFDFKIYSQNAAFKLSAANLSGSFTALGKAAPPSDVTNFNFTPDPNLGVLLKWNAVPDIDLDRYEIRRGTNWGSATLITQVQATTYKLGYLDDGTYTYLIKAIDTSGSYSTNAATIAVTIAGAGLAVISTSIKGSDLVLSWTAPAVTTYAIAYYRVTYGGSYASSIELTKTQSTSFTVPISWTGSRTFWVVPVDSVGKFTDPPNSQAVTITGAAAPTITTSVGGSTATLSWTAVAGTLPTAGYEIRQGGTFATATVLANITGTSYTLKATWSGSQTFWVVAQDVNGNYGTQASAVVTVNVAATPTLSSSFAGQNVVFAWSGIKGTLDTDYYLLKRGSTWGTATTVATIYGTAYTLKADWGGLQTFMLAAVDINGNEGTPGSLAVTVTVPTAPTITQQVIDNNVLLQWTDSTQTLPITAYELRKGATWASATVIGTKQGKFTTVFESFSGTYTYWLAGIDSAGNYGTPGSVSALVNQPPDYVLKFNQDSTFAGTITNMVAYGGGLLASVNTTETWTTHFTSRSWTSPQDQINAGYTYFMMPSTTTAQYYEDIDYGTVLAGTKVTTTLTSSVVAGSTTITPTISVKKLSTDAWTVYSGVSSVFATNFRYIRAQYDLASAGGDDLLQITGLNIRLDSKLRSDSGTGTAVSTDSGGTVVNFNIAFVDVDSISVTPTNSTGTAVIAVYDFNDVPYPTSFKVLLYNTSGTRVSGAFSWSAKGV